MPTENGKYSFQSNPIEQWFSSNVQNSGYARPNVFVRNAMDSKDRPYVMSLVGSQVVNTNSDASLLDMAFRGKDDSPWKQAQAQFEQVLEQRLQEHGSLEVHSGMSLGTDLIWARAAANVKYHHRNDPNHNLYLVADLPVGMGENGFGSTWSDRNRDFLQSFIKNYVDAAVVYGSAKTVSNLDNASYQALLDKRLQGMTGVSDETVAFADDLTTEVSQNNNIHQSGKEVTQITPQSVGLLNGQVEAENNTNQTDKKNYQTAYLPLMDTVPYVTGIENKPKTYWWRDANVSDDSPVTVDEFVRATASLLPSKKRVNALRGELKNNLSVEREADDVTAKDDDPKQTVSILQSSDRSAVYNMSPDQMETILSVLSTARSTGLDYDLKIGDRGSILMSVNDNAGSTVRLLDMQEPYRVGEVRTRDGVIARPMLSHIEYRLANEDVRSQTHGLQETVLMNGDIYPVSYHNNRNNTTGFASNARDYRDIKVYSGRNNSVAVNTIESRNRTLANYVGLSQNVKNTLALSPMISLLGLDKEMVDQAGIPDEMNIVATGSSRNKDALREDLDMGVAQGSIDNVRLVDSTQNIDVPGKGDIRLSLRSGVQITNSQFVTKKPQVSPSRYSQDQAQAALRDAYQTSRLNFFRLLNGDTDLREEYTDEQDKYKNILSDIAGDPESEGYPHKDEVEDVLEAVNTGLNNAQFDETHKNVIHDTGLVDARSQLDAKYISADDDTRMRVLDGYDRIVNQIHDYLGSYFTDYHVAEDQRVYNHALEQLQSNDSLDQDQRAVYERQVAHNDVNARTFNLTTMSDLGFDNSQQAGFDLANYLRQSGLQDKVTGTNDYAFNRIMERAVTFDDTEAHNIAELEALKSDPDGAEVKLQQYLTDIQQLEQETGELVDIASQPEPYNQYLVQRPVQTVVTDDQGNKKVQMVKRTTLIYPQSKEDFQINALKTVMQRLDAHGIKYDQNDIRIDNHGLIKFKGYAPMHNAYSHQVVNNKEVLRYRGDQLVRAEPDDDRYAGDMSLMTLGKASSQDYYDQKDLQDLEEKGASAEEINQLKAGIARRKELGLQDVENGLGSYAPIEGTLGQVFAPDHDGIIRTNYNTFDGHTGDDFAFLPNMRAWYQDFKKNSDGSWDVDEIRKELQNGLGANNRLKVETYEMAVDRELRQATELMLNTNNVGDLSASNSSTIMNKLLHSEVLGLRVPEGLLRAKPSAERNAKLATQLERTKMYASADQTTNTINEIDYLSDAREYMRNYAATHNGQVPDKAEVVAALQNSIALYGGGSVGVIDKPENWGLFSTNATAQGASQGITRFLASGAKVDNHGNVIPVTAQYIGDDGQQHTLMKPVVDSNNKPVLDADGKPLKMPVRVRQYATVEYLEALDTLFNSPFDRSFIATEQSLKAEWTDPDVNVAIMNPNLMTMEDASVISKDFAEKHQVPVEPTKYDADGNLVTRPIMVGDKLSDGSGNKTTVGHIIDPNMSLEQASEAGIENLVLLMRQNPQLDMIVSGTSQMSRLNMANAKNFLKQHENQETDTIKVQMPKRDENGNLIPKVDDNGQPIYRLDANNNPMLVRTKWADSNMSDQDLLDAYTNRDGMPLFEVDNNGVPKYALEYEMEDAPVDTNATMNKLYVIGTDQLIDHKVSIYDAGESASNGRMYSLLVANADNQRGMTNVANYMHRMTGVDDNSLRDFRSLLLTTGVDLDKNSKFVPMDTEKLKQELHRDVSPEFKLTGDKYDLAMKSGTVRKAGHDQPIVVDGHINSQIADKLNLNINLAYTGLENSTDALGDDTSHLTSDSLDLINQVTNKMTSRDQTSIAYNSAMSSNRLLDAGSEFVRQMPDNGLMKLPDGLYVHLRGLGSNTDGSLKETNELYVLPASMRKMTKMMDGTSKVDQYTSEYQRLGVKLAQYQVIRDTLRKGGVPANDGSPEAAVAQSLIDQQIAKNLNIQGTIDTLQNKIITNELGGNNNVRHSWLREKIMGRPMPHSATSQMGNNANLPIDAVEVSPKIAKQLGLVADPNDPNGFAHYKGHPEWQTVHFHRDPVWRSSGSLGMKVIINPELTGVRVNPMMVSLCDGDFDGDNVGLIGMPDELAQQDLSKMTPSYTLLSGAKDQLKNPSTGLNIGAEFVDQATKVNPELINYDFKAASDESQMQTGHLSDLSFKAQVLLGIMDRHPEMKLSPTFEYEVNGKIVQGQLTDDFKQQMANAGVDKSQLKLASDHGQDNLIEDPMTKNNKKFLNTYMADAIAQQYEVNSPDQAGVMVDNIILRIQNADGLTGEHNAFENSGNNYSNPTEFFESMNHYFESGAKGHADFREQMSEYLTMPTISEQMTELNKAQAQTNDQDAAEKFDEYLNGNDDGYKGALSIAQKAEQVQNATKIKSALTGIPGHLQQVLVAGLRQANSDGLYVANTIGYAGTQSNLQVKHDPDLARYQAELLKDVLGNLQNGRPDTTTPGYALVGPERTTTSMIDKNDQGVDGVISADDRQKAGAMLLGSDSVEVAQRLAKIDAKFGLETIEISGQEKKFKSTPEQVIKKVFNKDPKTDERLKDFAKNDLGLANVDNWSSEELTAFKNTIVQSQTPYEHGLGMAEGTKLTKDQFVKAMDNIYNNQLDLGIDSKIFDNLADHLANEKGEIQSIAAMSRSDGSASLIDRVNMSGYDAILDATLNHSDKSLFSAQDNPEVISNGIVPQDKVASDLTFERSSSVAAQLEANDNQFAESMSQADAMSKEKYQADQVNEMVADVTHTVASEIDQVQDSAANAKEDAKDAESFDSEYDPGEALEAAGLDDQAGLDNFEANNASYEDSQPSQANAAEEFDPAEALASAGLADFDEDQYGSSDEQEAADNSQATNNEGQEPVSDAEFADHLKQYDDSTSQTKQTQRKLQREKSMADRFKMTDESVRFEAPNAIDGTHYQKYSSLYQYVVAQEAAAVNDKAAQQAAMASSDPKTLKQIVMSHELPKRLAATDKQRQFMQARILRTGVGCRLNADLELQQTVLLHSAKDLGLSGAHAQAVEDTKKDMVQSMVKERMRQQQQATAGVQAPSKQQDAGLER